MNVLLLGDSHLGALKQGHAAQYERGEIPLSLDYTFAPLGSGAHLRTKFFSAEDSVVNVTSDIKRRKYSFPPPELGGEPVVYGISAPYHSAIVYRHPDWADFGMRNMGRGAMVSAALIKQVVLDDQNHILAFVRSLQATGASVFALECPRPFRHHPVVQKIGENAVAAIDGTYRSIMREQLDALGVPTVSAPKDTFDQASFSFEHFRSDRENDPHHGNAAYGRLMLSEINAFLTKEPSSRSRKKRLSAKL